MSGAAGAKVPRPGLDDFELFWETAARRVPIMVVGGGRWGRVWLRVLAEARGSAEGIVWVARTDTAEAARWRDGEPSLAGTPIEHSVQAAAVRGPRVAIVASRPRDHVRDASDALSAGLDVLVEKPIAPGADEARGLIRVARASGRTLGAGTEFALLPAFHLLGAALEAADAEGTFDLDWEDPAGEVRHGAAKARHEEIDMLVDLLPHAFSIFRAVRPGARLSLESAELDRSGDVGAIHLSDENGGRYGFTCRRSGGERRRLLTARAGERRGTVDFAQHPPLLTIDGAIVASPRAVALPSLLRIEIGAFLAGLEGLTRHRPLTSGLEALVELQAALERAR